MTQYEKLVVSAYTGVLMAAIDDYQNFVEQILGRPVMTVELGDHKIKALLQEKLRPEFLRLCKEEEAIERPKITPDVEFHLLMKKAFDQLPSSSLKKNMDPNRFATYDMTLLHPKGTIKEFADLRRFMSNHNIGASSEEFQECFFNVRQDWMRNHRQDVQVFNLNATIIDDDGFKGKVVAYNPEANMYKIEHELINGRLPVANGWYPPERLKAFEAKEKSSANEALDSMIAAAQSISEQSAQLTSNLQKHKINLERE